MLTLAKHSDHESAKKTQSPQPETNSEYVTFMFLASLVQCMHFRRFKKSHVSNYHPQLCAHGSFKITKQLVTEFVLSLTLHQIIPPLHPPVVPTGRFWGPWPPLLTASTAAPAARSCSTTAAWPLSAALCSGVQPQAPKGLGDVNGWRAPPRGSPPPTPPLQWEKLQSVE